MTWIFHLENPCHFMSQIDGSLSQIHTEFHDYSLSFIQVLFVFHAKIWHGFWTSSTHGVSSAFAKKISIGFGLIFESNQTAVKKTRKSLSYVLQGTHEFLLPDALNIYLHLIDHPVKNVTLYIFSCLFDGSLVENDTKSDGNPVIFLANAIEIPWLELVQNPCHVPAWRTNKIWINDME